MTINQRQKGKRVELSVVNWLKERGVNSARRSQQFCGKSGDADVVAADELPRIHIEVKGRTDRNLTNSLLRDWLKQLQDDSQPTNIPVIFFVANNHKPIVLLPLPSYEALVGLPTSDIFYINIKESFDPVTCLYTWEKQKRTKQLLKILESPYKFIAVHEISPGSVIIAMDAERALMYMKEYR